MLLLEQQTGLADDAEHSPVDVPHRDSADSVRSEPRDDLLERCDGPTVTTSVVITSRARRVMGPPRFPAGDSGPLPAPGDQDRFARRSKTQAPPTGAELDHEVIK
jgi:hypothetical protein